MLRKNHSFIESLKLAATLLVFGGSLPVCAQGLPPEPAAEATPTTTSPAATAPASPESSLPASPVATAETALVAAEGPMQAERQKLAETIAAAKQFGFGTTAYISAFNSLEERVKAGAPEPEIKNRLNSIVSGLDEQLKRAKQLKTQRPTPPVAASGPPASSLESQVRSQIGGMGGGNTDQLIDKLKDKWFGGEIPDSIKKKIPAGFDPSMLNSDQAKELLKRYGK